MSRTLLLRMRKFKPISLNVDTSTSYALREIFQPFPIFVHNFKSPDWKVPNSLVNDFAYEEEVQKIEEEYTKNLRERLGFGIIGESTNITED